MEHDRDSILAQYEAAILCGSLGKAYIIERANPNLAVEFARIRSKATGIIIPTTGNYI